MTTIYGPDLNFNVFVLSLASRLVFFVSCRRRRSCGSWYILRKRWMETSPWKRVIIETHYQGTYAYNWTYHWYEIDLSFEHDDYFELDYFEPSLHSVAATKYYVCMYDCVTRMVRFVMLRLKRRAVRWWSCSRDIFVQLNVSLVWNWFLVRTWRSFWVRVFLSQVNTLWLWLYTMWSYTFKRSIYYGINLNLFRT